MRFLGTLVAALLVPALVSAQDTTAVKGYVRRDSIDAQSIYNASRSTTVRAAANRIKARTDSIYKALRKKDTTIVVVTPPPQPKPDTTTPTTSGFDGPAELPRASVDTVRPTGYNVVSVGANIDAFQQAVNMSACRTELRLTPGFTYNLASLPVKPCAERYGILVRTGNGLADMPRGQRITPGMSLARKQATIQSKDASNMPALLAGATVHGFYFEDVAFAASGTTPLNAIVYLGNAQTTLAQVPSDLVFSHVLISGTPTLDLKRCVYLNSARTAIVDSWLQECHSNNGDSQAILCLNGPGPYLIDNNYLEAGHEVVMCGGGDPSITDLIPSDITLTGNHITRPSSWKGVWQVKNLIELKNARRVLIEGNVVENVWADGQVGYALLFKSVNQDGTAAWSQTRDVTVRYNLIRNMGAGVNLCANCQAPAVNATAFSIRDNIFLGVNCGTFTGEAREWQFLQALTKVSILHNTTLNACGVQTAISFDGQPPKITGMNFQSNVYDPGLYDIHGGSGGTLFGTFVDSASSKWTNNAKTSAGFDAKGYYTGSVLGHDGKPIGADAALVYQKTARAVVADPTRAARRRTIASAAQSKYRPTSQAQREINTRH